MFLELLDDSYIFHVRDFMFLSVHRVTVVMWLLCGISS